MRKNKKATSTESPTTSTPAPSVSVAPISGPLEFTAGAKSLGLALKRVAGFADTKSSMPILGYVAIRATSTEVTLVTTNLDAYAAHVSNTWRITGTGHVLVPVKGLADMLKRMPDAELTIRDCGGRISLVCSGVTMSLETLPARDYPKVPDIMPESPVLSLHKVDTATLATMIDAMRPCVCRDQTRFHLAGIFMESTSDAFRMVATDGHRLAKIQRPALDSFRLPKGVIWPEASAGTMRKLLGKGDTEIGMLGEKLVVRHGGTTVAMKLTDAQFPPYAQVIPSGDRRLVTVDRAALASAVERSLVLTSDTRGLELEIVPNGIKLSASHPDLGQASETIPAELNPAGAFKIGANSKYLLAALNTIADERVTLSFGANDAKIKGADHTIAQLDPIIIRGTTDFVSRPVSEAAFLVVVMPMRI